MDQQEKNRSAIPKAQTRQKASDPEDMFSNNKFLEFWTRTHILVPTSILAIVAAGFVIYGWGEAGGIAKTIGLFFIGFFGFTLVEYSMHRWLYHMVANTPWKEQFVYKVHGFHHEHPRDKYRLALPAPVTLVLAFVVFYACYGLMGGAAYAFAPGFIMGYVFYLGVHYVVHMVPMPKNFMKIFWVHHMLHHHQFEHRAFGVSSPLWDVFFRTLPTYPWQNKKG